MRRAIAILAAALALAAALPSQAAPVTTNEDYIALGTSDVANECKDENATGMNIGGACLNIGANKDVKVTIADTVSPNVSFYWIFQDADGECATQGPPALPGEDYSCDSNGFSCGQLNTTTPPRTARLEVFVDGPAFTALGPCAPGTAYPGVVGTITFRVG